MAQENILVADAKAKQTQAVQKVYHNPLVRNQEVFWGQKNDYPQEVYNKISKNNTVMPLLRTLARIITKGELVYGYNEIVDEQTVFKRLQIPEFEAFKKRANVVDKYLHQSTSDYLRYGLVVPELLFSADKKRVLSISALKANFTRFKADSFNEISEKTTAIFYDANRIYYNQSSELTRKEIQVLDTEGDTVQNFWEADYFRAIYLVSQNQDFFPYPKPDWHVILESGSLEIVAEMLKSQLDYVKNARKLNYNIKLNEMFFEIMHGKQFYTKSIDERNALRKEAREKLKSIMDDRESDGKSIITIVLDMLPESADLLPRKVDLVEITPIPNVMQDSMNVKILEFFTNQVNIAVGIPSSIMGTPTESNLGGNSGSNVTASYDQTSDLAISIQRELLAPLNFVLDLITKNTDLEQKNVFCKMVAPPIPKLNQISQNQRKPDQKIQK
jgi:hypothetical protein